MKGSKEMNIQRFAIVLLAGTLLACASIKPVLPPPQTSLPVSEPTSTNSDPMKNSEGHTVLRFEFPFEPSSPGYLVDVKSTALTANLMCVLQQGETTGEVLELSEDTSDPRVWGTCDTSSMTLDVLIADQITVTVILGGHPLVDEVTKTPDALTEQRAEYYFESTPK
jgi:hypothetical protein